MGELLIRKAIACRDRLARIRAALPARPEDLLTDDRLEAFIAFNIFLLVQDAIDLAAHLVSARGLGVPSSHRDSFNMLVRAGVITSETGEAMARAAGLRNRIAHSYGDLDPVRMAREAPAGLETISGFLDEITPALTAP